MFYLTDKWEKLWEVFKQEAWYTAQYSRIKFFEHPFIREREREKKVNRLYSFHVSLEKK